MIVVSRLPMSEHGTLGRYSSGCHCVDCRRAMRDYQRARRAAEKFFKASSKPERSRPSIFG